MRLICVSLSVLAANKLKKHRYFASCQSIAPAAWANVGSAANDPLSEIRLDREWYRSQPRMAVAQRNANDPIEDRALLNQIRLSNGETVDVVAVIDGHGGWQVADYVQQKLSACICASLDEQLAKGDKLSDSAVEEAMKNAYVKLDGALMELLRGSYMLGLSRTAKIGACCLTALIFKDKIVIANAGDCEAVMARKRRMGLFNGATELTAVQLSRRHNADQPDEQVQLKLKHPGEDNIVQCKKASIVPRMPTTSWDRLLLRLGLLGLDVRQMACYVKGRLQPTRSFGDFYLKHRSFAYDTENGRPFFKLPNSFPYITVEPEIKILKRSQSDQFLILGTDGVWDFLSHEEAIKAASPIAVNRVGTVAIADAILAAVFSKAAQEAGMTVTQLAKAPGSQKRRLHDDTTVVVYDLTQTS